PFDILILDKAPQAVDHQRRPARWPQGAMETAEYLLEVAGQQAQVQLFAVQAIATECQLHLAIAGNDAPRLQGLVAVELEMHAAALQQFAIQPVAVLTETGLADPAGQVQADPHAFYLAGQAGPVPEGFRAHVAGRPVVMGKGVQRRQVEVPQSAAHAAATAHAGHLLRIDPAVDRRWRADAHGLKLMFAEAGLDARAVIQDRKSTRLNS